MDTKKYLVLKPNQTSTPHPKTIGWGWELKAVFICETFTALLYKAGNKYRSTINGEVIYEDENHHYLSAKCIWTNAMRMKQDPSLLEEVKKQIQRRKELGLE